MAPAKATSSPWRPRRQSRVNTLNSISAMLSQLACLAETVGLDPVVQHAVQTLRGVSPLDRTGWPSPSPTRPEVALPQPSTPPVAPGQARGGTTALLENQCPGTSRAAGGGPPSYGVRVPGQRRRRGRPGPPPRVVARGRLWASNSMAYRRARSRGVGARIIRRGRSLTPICHDAHLPLFQNPVYLPDSHHSPIPTRLSATCLDLHFTLTLCAFHLGFGLGGAIAGVQNSLSPLAGQQA